MSNSLSAVHPELTAEWSDKNLLPASDKRIYCRMNLKSDIPIVQMTDNVI